MQQYGVENAGKAAPKNCPFSFCPADQSITQPQALLSVLKRSVHITYRVIPRANPNRTVIAEIQIGPGKVKHNLSKS